MLPSGMTMPNQKLSISLPEATLRFIEQYRTAKGRGSRSQVIEEALSLLQERELEAAYRESSLEIDGVWDVAIADGLADKL